MLKRLSLSYLLISLLWSCGDSIGIKVDRRMRQVELQKEIDSLENDFQKTLDSMNKMGIQRMDTIITD